MFAIAAVRVFLLCGWLFMKSASIRVHFVCLHVTLISRVHRARVIISCRDRRQGYFMSQHVRRSLRSEIWNCLLFYDQTVCLLHFHVTRCGSLTGACDIIVSTVQGRIHPTALGDCQSVQIHSFLVERNQFYKMRTLATYKAFRRVKGVKACKMGAIFCAYFLPRFACSVWHFYTSHVLFYFIFIVACLSRL